MIGVKAVGDFRRLADGQCGLWCVMAAKADELSINAKICLPLPRFVLANTCAGVGSARMPRDVFKVNGSWRAAQIFQSVV